MLACTLASFLFGVSEVCGKVAISRALLPEDRATIWNPGLNGSGGIPERTTECAFLTPLGGSRDDVAQIQAAINACAPGQVVRLSAGTFLINGGNNVLLNKGITLRGAGPDSTVLAKTDGAKPFPAKGVGAHSSPVIVVGPARFSNTANPNGTDRSTNLSVDAAKGAYEISVEDTAGFSAGQYVLLDEVSGASWQADPLGNGKVWASPDFRVVWQKHDPPHRDDDFAKETFPTTPESAGSWFSRQDRPTSEIKEIASISGSKIVFTTPLHISYRTRNAAQISRYAWPHVKYAGVEDLKVIGGDHGNFIFQWAAMSWAKNVECTQWTGAGFAILSSFRTELREFYVHDSAWVHTGGGSYAIVLSLGSSEILVENGIAVRVNKVMVVNSAGAGSVFGYNYMDMGYISYKGSWIETGLNASHMVGSHHVLLEGNYAHNADNDNTHGNSIYHTFFRNYLPGIRAPFENQAGERIDDAQQRGNGPKRSAGLTAYSYWMSFIGNVLGLPGQMRGWVYETSFASGRPGIWMLGWGEKTDTRVAATTLRHGNFDFLTNTVRWDPAIAERALPDSLYLTRKPAFFDAGGGYRWPWINPAGETNKVRLVLPAKARYDAGTPFAQP